MKYIIIFLMCFIIVLLCTGCADTSDFTGGRDVMPLIVHNIDSLCEKINESKKSENQDYILTYNKVNEIEKVVYPELNNVDFDLYSIMVSQYSIQYHFKPKGDGDTSVMFSYCEMHNSLADAIDELEIMRLLNYRLGKYALARIW